MEAPLSRSGGSCCSAHCGSLRVSFVQGRAVHRQRALLQILQPCEHQSAAPRRGTYCLSRAADTDSRTEGLARNSPAECCATNRNSQETLVRQQPYQYARLAGLAAVLSTSLLLVAQSADAAEALPLDIFAAFLVRLWRASRSCEQQCHRGASSSGADWLSACAQAKVQALGPWGPGLFILTVLCCEMIPLFPTQPLALSSGLLFGPYEVMGTLPQPARTHAYHACAPSAESSLPFDPPLLTATQTAGSAGRRVHNRVHNTGGVSGLQLVTGHRAQVCTGHGEHRGGRGIGERECCAAGTGARARVH